MKREIAVRLADAKTGLSLAKEVVDQLRATVAGNVAVDPMDLDPETVVGLSELGDFARAMSLDLGSQSMTLLMAGTLIHGKSFGSAVQRLLGVRDKDDREAAAAAAIAIAQEHAEKAGRR